MDDLAAHLKELESTRAADPQDGFAALSPLDIWPFPVNALYCDVVLWLEPVTSHSLRQFQNNSSG
ncbi:hypothetical protein ACCT14_18250 [Rhizobium brockwellii]|uniref:Uncharacterized protein n=2 Tax=Rhizobium TaxID=379 RepID=A0ABU3YU62_9HYPH|nr:MULTISPECIES: hypothetical protein [Rhizobium]KPN27278.1 hypothetical protein KS05_02540 [Rhizobium brockwellii]MDV4157312.1 hypothetical protein [Rhizobium brockwellii]MDV4182231.1 hypothetical protein [Rhizobium brockwellii]MDV4189378.1 hypothetical protein [Rhizobium brockwellii]NZD53882.1 hypothetical protein [Rhizobium leguminosarum]